MQVGWGRPPPRVVHVVGRRGGGVLCVFALWCMGTLALTSSIRSPRWWRRSPQLTTQAGDVDMAAGARVARVVGRWYDRLGTARHGTARHELACRTALHRTTACRGSARYGGTPRLGPARHATVRLGSAQPGSARLGYAELGSSRPGSARLDSARL